MSIIRVVDRVIIAASGPEPPEAMPPFMVEDIQMVVSLKSDQAKGRHTLKFVMEAPDGSRQPLAEQDVNLTPGNSGINLTIPVRLGLQLEGIYWIDVIFGGPHGQKDVLLSRVPLEAVYQRQRVAAPPSPTDPAQPE